MVGVALAVLILVSVYFATNKKLETRSKTGYFTVVFFGVVIWLIFGVLLNS